MFIKIRNAHIYSPEDEGIQDLLICGKTIIRIGDLSGFAWDYDDIEEIDAAGMILVPGFIDQHVHIIGGGGEDGYSSLIREVQMTDCIRSGVTGVVGLLGTDANVKSVAALVARTKALKEQGISAWCLTGSYKYPSTTLTGSVAQDIAFIDEVIGVKVAISDHRSSNISADELARLATEVRTASLLAGKPGVVHMHTGRGKKGYTDVVKIIRETDIPVWHFRPTHVNMAYPGAAEFAAMGGYVDFTSGEDTSASAKRIREAMETVPLAQMTLSSDSNGSFPKWDKDGKLCGMGVGRMDTLYATVRKLVQEQGVPLERALQLITSTPADALMLKNKGRIAEGKDADIVLLDSSLHIDTVIALGRISLRSGKLTVKDYYEY
ncbi:MAG: beta-aspartyl-peptidase [Solobacterium sp.]|nr:beta-aspartyl-peptidase [Solobacterium sp.]